MVSHHLGYIIELICCFVFLIRTHALLLNQSRKFFVHLVKNCRFKPTIISESHKDRWCWLHMPLLIPFQSPEGPMPMGRTVLHWGAKIWGGECRCCTTGQISWPLSSFCPLRWTTVLYSLPRATENEHNSGKLFIYSPLSIIMHLWGLEGSTH